MMRWGKIRACACALLMTALLALSGCGQEQRAADSAAPQGGPIEITDVAGRTVTFERPVQKVLLQWSGMGGGFITMAALVGQDLPDYIAGLDTSMQEDRLDMWNAFSNDMPQLKEIPTIGNADNNTFNTEAAIASGADVAFIPLQMKKKFEETIQPKLEQAGIQTVYIDFHAEKLENHKQTIEIMGRLLGKEERAQEIIGFYEQKVTPVYERIQKIQSPKPTVYVEVGMQGPEAFGNAFSSNFSWGGLVTQCGGDLITAGIVQRAEPINPELVLEKDPQIIFIMGSYWPSRPTSMFLGFEATPAEAQQRLAAFTQRDGWNNLSAVRDKQVYSIHHGICREVYDCAVVEYFAKTFYPEEFKDLDPAGTFKEFYERFLPFTYGGLWFYQLQ